MTTQYDVSVAISYVYDRPAMNGRNLLRLSPANLGDLQRVVAQSLSFSPDPEERRESVDFFGNRVVDAAWRSPHEKVSFRLAARVVRNAPSSSLDISPDRERLAQELAQARGLDAASPHHFTGPSPRVRPSRELTDFATAVIRPSMTVFAIADLLSKAIHERMEFDAAATTVDTTPQEAFAKKRGVCQDFTHIMIACLRGVGVPAAYVSGLLRTVPPAGGERLEGADAMHAWVRVWCGQETGWVEFDPTNAMLAGEDHIVVGYGRDYTDVAPVRGVLRSSGAQSSTQAVDVVPLAARN